MYSSENWLGRNEISVQKMITVICFTYVLIRIFRFELLIKQLLTKYLVIEYHYISLLTAHHWQKRKSRFLKCPCHKIYRIEAVGLFFPRLYFCEHVKFGAISRKCEIWGNFEKIWYFDNCSLKFESKNPFTHIIVIICRTPHFVST